MSELISRFERIIKRNIRNSKKFKKDATLEIHTVKSHSFKLFLKIFNKINEKNNLNIKLKIEYYKNPGDLWNSIKNNRDTIVFVPNEVIISMFILDISGLLKNSLYYKKTLNYINLAYGISEYYICKELKQEYNYFFEDSFEIIEKFVVDAISRDTKYIRSPLRVLEYIEENIQKWQDSS